MAPHTLDTILQAPQWPPSLSHFVTWCLAWDPKVRPTCAQAMSHEYFTDAFDPLRPKSSGSKLLGRKHASFYDATSADSNQTLSSKTSSWFRRSLIARESAPTVPQAAHHEHSTQSLSPRMSPVRQEGAHDTHKQIEKARPNPSKRNTWTHDAHNHGAPMPILPSIRPISPLSNAVTAQAHAGAQRVHDQQTTQQQNPGDRKPKKLGRQLSQASQGNHYADTHRQEAEKALNGQSGLASPTSGHKESFFSHLRKRARRLSGRHAIPLSPKVDDVEASPGCTPWANPRNSMAEVTTSHARESTQSNFMDLDNALQNARYSVDASAHVTGAVPSASTKSASKTVGHPSLKRHHSLPQAQPGGQSMSSQNSGLRPSRSTRRIAQKPNLATDPYEAPDEQEELLDEALNSAQVAMMHLDRQQPNGPRGSYESSTVGAHPRPRAQQVASESTLLAPYPTPSPSAKRNSVIFGHVDQNAQPSKPIDIHQAKQPYHGTAFPFPTPPDENEWAAAAAASLGLGEQWRR